MTPTQIKLGKTIFEEDVTSPGRWRTIQETGFYDVHTEQQLLHMGGVIVEEEHDELCATRISEKPNAHCNCNPFKPAEEIVLPKNYHRLNSDLRRWVKQTNSAVNTLMRERGEK